IGPLPLKEKKLEQKVLFTENIVVLLPIHHRLAKESSVKLQELIDEPFVLLPEGFVFRDIVVNACQNLGFTPNVAFEGDD
ncbi:LysR substrate-binding domain-containing protein, partial [Escherichia coli]|nr:LysR substrate-binding domain-containing protein [Escherichia coli]